MPVKKLKHCLSIALAVFDILAAQSHFSELKSRAADHPVFIGYLPFGFKVTVGSNQMLNGSFGRGFQSVCLLFAPGHTLGIGKFEETFSWINHRCIIGMTILICPVGLLVSYKIMRHTFTQIEVGGVAECKIAVGQHTYS